MASSSQDTKIQPHRSISDRYAVPDYYCSNACKRKPSSLNNKKEQLDSNAQSLFSVITLRLQSPIAWCGRAHAHARGHHNRYHPRGGDVDGGPGLSRGPRHFYRPWSDGCACRSYRDARDRTPPLIQH
jgi:hypothetical protein